MDRVFCFTTDLESDFLSDDCHEVLTDPDRMRRIRDFLGEHAAPVTAFVVGRMLDEGLPVREAFEGLPVEYELHSWSHRIDAADTEEEIRHGKEAYRRVFGADPRGYRAPSGRISRQGIASLREHRFTYDASVFPAWRPEQGYDYRRLPTAPWRYADAPELLEVPFAVVPRVRVVLSLSFLKLFGLAPFRAALRVCGLPPVVVFDSHLYDFFLTRPVREMSRLDWRRHALTRNQDRVFDLLADLLALMRRQGYRFATMGELVADLREGTLPEVPSTRLMDRG